MVNREKIEEIVLRELEGKELYLIEVNEMGSGEYEIIVDADGSVSIDSCAELNRAVMGELDGDNENFALTVSSAGIGRPLKVLRQYSRLVGKSVEVVLKSGVKLVATLEGVTQEELTLSYEEVEKMGEKRKKQTVKKEEKYRMDEVKSTVEFLDYK